MASMTREQFKKWNEKNKNGFVFDIRHFIMHNEKTVARDITMEDGKILRVTIMFTDEYVRTDSGYNRPTGKQVPTVHFSEYTDNGRGMLIGHGIGYFDRQGNTIDKKNYSVLQALTEKFDTDKLINRFAELKRTKVNQYA